MLISVFEEMTIGEHKAPQYRILVDKSGYNQTSSVLTLLRELQMYRRLRILVLSFNDYHVSIPLKSTTYHVESNSTPSEKLFKGSNPLYQPVMVKSFCGGVGDVEVASAIPFLINVLLHTFICSEFTIILNPHSNQHFDI